MHVVRPRDWTEGSRDGVAVTHRVALRRPATVDLTVIQVQVSVPHYSTAQPSTSDDEHAIRVVLRDSVGRELLAPDANVSVYPPVGIVKRAQHSALGSEIILTNVEAGGTYMTFESSVSGVTVKDEVWVAGPDQQTERIVASVGSVICLEGAGWRGPASAGVLAGSAVSAAVPRH
ncbi:unnamed protein product [Plutella xylostella]|uniref:(diamondback moth) hypothetical protein n=1 Tax=Plutella xylostella TaxID=51655 RepID=A0A8S4E952_PLUXY|nr:unnamed protein product [Plutella xylostella]